MKKLFFVAVALLVAMVATPEIKAYNSLAKSVAEKMNEANADHSMFGEDTQVTFSYDEDTDFIVLDVKMLNLEMEEKLSEGERLLVSYMMKEEMANYICDDSDFRMILGMGLSFTLNFYDKNGQMVANFDITSDDL